MAVPTAAEHAEIFAGVGSWLVCSVGMLVFNKVAVTVLPLQCTLVILQLVFTVLVMLGCCWNLLHIGSSKDLLRWLIVIPFFTGMLLTSMFALSAASLTTVVTFRAVSPLVAMTVEQFYPNPLRVTRSMVGSIVTMIGGAVLYAGVMGVSDRSAIAILLINNCFGISDRLLQRLMLAKDQNPVDMSKTAITLVNNAGGAIVLVVAAFFHHEVSAIPGAFARLSHLDIFWIVASCIVSVGLSYCGVWAQSLISATSFIVLINASKFGVIFCEAFVWRTKKLTWAQVIGASIVVLASMAYGKAREHAERENKAESMPITAKP